MTQGEAHNATAMRSGLRSRSAAALLVVALAALATVFTVRYPVSDNVRYVVGLLRVSGFSPAETFTHRPIVYRMLMAAHMWLPGVVTEQAGPPHSMARLEAFETGLNVVAILLAAGAGLLVWAGLRRHARSQAWAYGVAAFAALAFLAPMLGEPDWYAALFAVAAVGAGLLGGRWLGGTLAGVLLAMSALVKFVTLPIALAAIVVLWALDAGRAWIAASTAFVFGSLVLVAICFLAPWEVGWLLDIRALQPAAWGPHSAAQARNTLIQLAVMWPAILLLPAFFLGATRKEKLVGTVGLLLVAAPVVLQGEYWLYHTISLVVLSCLLAVRTVLRSRGALVWPILACSAWTALVYVIPVRFHMAAGGNSGTDIVAHGKRVILVAATCIVGLLILQWWALRRQARTSAAPAPTTRVQALTVLALMASLLASQTPAALVAPTAQRARHGNEAAAVRQVIGDDPVVYASPGWSTYFLGNPTRCRYPSPLFLQRSEAARRVAPADRNENLACLSWDEARGLVCGTRTGSNRNTPPPTYCFPSSKPGSARRTAAATATRCAAQKAGERFARGHPRRTGFGWLRSAPCSDWPRCSEGFTIPLLLLSDGSAPG